MKAPLIIIISLLAFTTWAQKDTTSTGDAFERIEAITDTTGGYSTFKFSSNFTTITYPDCPNEIFVGKGDPVSFCWQDVTPLDCWVCAKKIKQGEKVKLQTFERYISRNPGTVRTRREGLIVHLICNVITK